MVKKLLAAIGVVVGLLLLGTMHLWSPGEAGAGGMLIIFLLFYALVAIVLTFLFFYIARAIRRMSRQRDEPVSLRRAYYYGSVMAIAPTLLIALQSVGQLNGYDILLIVLFIAIACLYIAKRAD